MAASNPWLVDAPLPPISASVFLLSSLCVCLHVPFPSKDTLNLGTTLISSEDPDLNRTCTIPFFQTRSQSQVLGGRVFGEPPFNPCKCFLCGVKAKRHAATSMWLVGAVSNPPGAGFMRHTGRGAPYSARGREQLCLSTGAICPLPELYVFGQMT